MKLGIKPILLGGFVVGAALLVVIALLTIGTGNPFMAVGRFVCYPPGSAAGLDDGTAVRLDGVLVGQVEKVQVIYDNKRRRALARVTCEIKQDRLAEPDGRVIQLRSEKELQRMIQEGLRGQIETAGIVGAEFVSLNFSPSNHPDTNDLPPGPYPLMPMIPSQMAQMMDSAEHVMTNLQKADFAGVVNEARKTIASIDEQVKQLQTNRLTDHLSTAASSIGKLAGSTNMDATIGQLRGAAANLSRLMTNLNAQIGPLAGKADATLTESKKTLASIDHAAQNVGDFVGLRDQLGEQTRQLMDQLTETARTVEQLADFLRQHPNALLTGRSQEAGTP